MQLSQCNQQSTAATACIPPSTAATASTATAVRTPILTAHNRPWQHLTHCLPSLSLRATRQSGLTVDARIDCFCSSCQSLGERPATTNNEVVTLECHHLPQSLLSLARTLYGCCLSTGSHTPYICVAIAPELATATSRALTAGCSSVALSLLLPLH